MKITEFPLIAVTEIFDMPSTDNSTYNCETGTVLNGPCHEIIEEKLDEVFERYTWSRDEKFKKPCWIFERGELYPRSYDDTVDKQRMIGNGHRRAILGHDRGHRSTRIGAWIVETLDTEFDLLMYFLKRQMPLDFATAWVSHIQDTGEGVVTWDESKYYAVKEFDIGGYPFYTVTVGPLA